MNGRARTAGAALAVLLTLGTAGCGSDSAKSSAASGAVPGSAAQPQQQPQPMSGQAAKAGAPTLAARSIAYSGQLALLTGDVPKLRQRATELATTAGGYVERENDSSYQDGNPGAQLVLKVPAAQFQTSLDQLAALGGQVLSRTSQADDQTQQVVDVDSRLKSQQASVDRVRALMEKAQTLADVVSLEGELSRREADLESLKSQQQALSASTSFATITLDLRTQAPAPAPAVARKGSFGGSLGHALRGGWNVLFAIVRGLLIGLAAVAPFLLLLAPVGWYLLRRRPKPAAAVAEEMAEERED